jgi:hypothetical protein
VLNSPARRVPTRSGCFRFGPFGIKVPRAWIQELSTNARPLPTRATHSCARRRASKALAEIDLVCEPAFDSSRLRADWDLSADRHQTRASGTAHPIELVTDDQVSDVGSLIAALQIDTVAGLLR